MRKLGFVDIDSLLLHINSKKLIEFVEDGDKLFEKISEELKRLQTPSSKGVISLTSINKEELNEIFLKFEQGIFYKKIKCFNVFSSDIIDIWNLLSYLHIHQQYKFNLDDFESDSNFNIFCHNTIRKMGYLLIFDFLNDKDRYQKEQHLIFTDAHPLVMLKNIIEYFQGLRNEGYFKNPAIKFVYEKLNEINNYVWKLKKLFTQGRGDEKIKTIYMSLYKYSKSLKHFTNIKYSECPSLEEESFLFVLCYIYKNIFKIFKLIFNPFLNSKICEISNFDPSLSFNKKKF